MRAKYESMTNYESAMDFWRNLLYVFLVILIPPHKRKNLFPLAVAGCLIFLFNTDEFPMLLHAIWSVYLVFSLMRDAITRRRDIDFVKAIVGVIVNPVIAGLINSIDDFLLQTKQQYYKS